VGITTSSDGPRSCGKKALTSHIHRRLSAVCRQKACARRLCSTGYGASKVARKLHKWLSMSSIATSFMNGSVKPSGNVQGDDTDGTGEYAELAVV
jgi:hypothetical protein